LRLEKAWAEDGCSGCGRSSKIAVIPRSVATKNPSFCAHFKTKRDPSLTRDDGVYAFFATCLASEASVQKFVIPNKVRDLRVVWKTCSCA